VDTFTRQRKAWCCVQNDVILRCLTARPRSSGGSGARGGISSLKNGSTRAMGRVGSVGSRSGTFTTYSLLNTVDQEQERVDDLSLSHTNVNASANTNAIYLADGCKCSDTHQSAPEHQRAGKPRDHRRQRRADRRCRVVRANRHAVAV
jgi:hypothetical protein